jgi:hypothetical protein
MYAGKFAAGFYRGMNPTETERKRMEKEQAQTPQPLTMKPVPPRPRDFSPAMPQLASDFQESAPKPKDLEKHRRRPAARIETPTPR